MISLRMRVTEIATKKDGTLITLQKDNPNYYTDIFRFQTTDKLQIDDEVIVVVKRLEEE